MKKIFQKSRKLTLLLDILLVLCNIVNQFDRGSLSWLVSKYDSGNIIEIGYTLFEPYWLTDSVCRGYSMAISKYNADHLLSSILQCKSVIDISNVSIERMH